jgi:pyridoxine kinase
MAKVLSISSQVIYGHVGNSAAGFVLQRMGHDVLAAPTIILSNRPGYKAIAGEVIEPTTLDAMLHAALANGALDGLGAILTGYMPTPGHAEFCRSWIETIRARNPDCDYLCDPIIGDEPSGVYVAEDAARAVRDLLVPLADSLTPNAFELGWLTGRTIADPAGAIAAAKALRRPTVVATSAPAAPGMLANLCVEGGQAVATQSPKRIVQAHGTGDFFAAIFLAHKLNGFAASAALRAATAAIDFVLERSAGRSELALVETQDVWAAKAPALAALTTVQV